MQIWLSIKSYSFIFASCVDHEQLIGLSYILLVCGKIDYHCLCVRRKNQVANIGRFYAHWGVCEVCNSSYKSDTSYHTAPKWMHDLFCACLPCVLLFLLTLAARHHTHSSFYLQNTSYLSHKRCEFHFNHIFVVYARSGTATKYQIMK